MKKHPFLVTKNEKRTTERIIAFFEYKLNLPEDVNRYFVETFF